MQYSPLLPRLKEKDHVVTSFESTGDWQDRDAIELHNISRSLSVTTASSQYTEIDSIPSMWARPLLFEMALYDTGHPMHECILGEWRGLLTMLALKVRRNFPLTTERIEIPDSDDTAAPELLRALRRLLPEHTLDAQTTWDKLHLILFNGKPIGLTSPTTLVCTSVSYVDCLPDVPWFDGQFLCDPTSKLNQEEKAAVASWLMHLHAEKLVSLPEPDPNLDEGLRGRVAEITDTLKGLIRDFCDDDLGGAPANEVARADTGLGLTQGIFRGMNNPIAAKEFFTEKLFVIRRPNPFHEGATLCSDELNVNGNRVTPILPIKDKLLAELGVDELKDRITFEETENGIKVNLRLPSSGTNGQNEDFVISQEYVAKAEGR